MTMRHNQNKFGNFSGSLLFNSRFIYINVSHRDEDAMDPEQLKPYQKQQLGRKSAEEVDEYRGKRMGELLPGVHNEAITANRLGIREAIAGNLESWSVASGSGKREAGLQIIDHSVTESQKTLLKAQIRKEREQRGLWESMVMKPREVWSSIKGIYNEKYDDLGVRLENSFGTSERIEDKRVYVAEQVMAPLSPLERSEVEARLRGLGVTLPPSGIPNGVDPQVFLLSLATPSQLEKLRANANVGGTLIFPQRPVTELWSQEPLVPPDVALARLIQLRKIELSEKHKRLAVSAYDPNLIQNFLTDIENSNPDIHAQIVGSLEPGSLYNLEDNPRALALLGKLEMVFRTRGSQDAQALLTAVRSQLPTVAEKRQEGVEASDELEQIEQLDSLVRGLPDLRNKLSELYADADAVGQTLYNLNVRLAATQAAVTGSTRDRGPETNLQSNISSTENRVEDMRKKIRNLENKYNGSVTTLFGIVDSRKPLPTARASGNDPYANLRQLQSSYVAATGVPESASGSPVGPIALSNPDELFGITSSGSTRPATRTPSKFETHINSMSDDNFKGMKKEIARQYHPLFQQRKKITTEEMLFLIEREEQKADGNNALADSVAYIETQKKIRLAENKQKYNRVNKKIGEYLGETTLGYRWLNRSRKWLKRQLGDEIFEAQDVIDIIPERNAEQSIFIGMPPDLSLVELRKWISDRGGISQKALEDYIQKLNKVFERNVLPGGKGKVELSDHHAKLIEDLSESLETLYAEKDSEALINYVSEHADDEVGANLTYVRELANRRLANRKKSLEQMSGKYAPNFLRWLRKKEVKKDVWEDYLALREQAAEEGLSSGEIRELEKEKGFGAASKQLRNKYRRHKAKKITGVVGRGLFWKAPVGVYKGSAYATRGAWKATAAVARTTGKVVKGTYHAAGWTIKAPFRGIGAVFKFLDKKLFNL